MIYHIIEKIWRTPEIYLEADPGGQPGTDIEVKLKHAFMYVCLIIGLLGSGFQFFNQK